MDFDTAKSSLLDLARNGDYSLTVNGLSKHLNSPVERNENNGGFGLMAEKDGRFLTAGGYKNSWWNPSYYVGGGIKKRFGHDYFVDVGLLGGLVSGYGNGGVIPMAMPMASFGKKGLGAINAMYGMKHGGTPSTLMFNMSIPFK